MTASRWSSDQIDLLKIDATGYSGGSFDGFHLTREGDDWVAGGYWDASESLREGQQVTSPSRLNGTSHPLADNGPHAAPSGDFFPAPETYGFSPVATLPMLDIPAIGDPNENNSTHKKTNPFEMSDLPRRFATYPSASPPGSRGNPPDSPYSSCVSDTSNSAYPPAIPEAYSNLSHSSTFVAEPLVGNSTSSYPGFFANPSETLCLFNDVAAQYYPTPESPVSSSSPAPTSTANPTPVIANYSGPIKNHIVNMYQDKDGIVWIVFPYSKNKEVKNHTIRCDVEKVPPSALREEIKTVSAAVASH
jgi:hypothetical protein